jgi:hypothetical protein
VDKAGDVYITDYQGQRIDEYAHGGSKPIYVLSDSDYPYGCAIDPKTGDLAVADFGARYDDANGNRSQSDAGNVAIYVRARGKPKYYDSCGDGDHFTAVGYDKYGDLLAEASYEYSEYYSGIFCYLPARTKSFAEIDLPGPSSSWEWFTVYSVLWDGKYWAIDDYDVYRYAINIKAVYVDTISLADKGGLGPIAIYRKTPNAYGTQIVGTSGYYSGSDYVTYWKYPAGGTPIYQSTAKDLDKPYGIAVSLKQ